MIPDAILFDLDGTLVDSIPLIVHCYQTILMRELALHIPDDEIVPHIGRSLYDLFEMHAPGRSEPLVAAYRAYMLAIHDDWVSVFAGIDPLLDALAAREMAIGLVTAKSLPSARPALEGFGLGARMQVVVTWEDTERHKPAPDPLLCAAGKLGVAPERCWYVGDSVHDLHAARAAGMQAIAAGWGPTAHEILRPLADTLLETPADLLRRLGAP